MKRGNQLDIQEFLDSRPFGGFHWKILLLCFAILVFDGFDVVVMGFIAPVVVDEWKISPAAMGPVFGMCLLGLAVGALIVGPLSDKLGRRKVIMGAVFFFGVMTLASALSPNIVTLSILRFLTGLGLGASQPNAATLAAEYAPKKYRSLTVMVVYCGFTLGAASAGFLANWLIPHYGWTSILIAGGIVPIVFAALLFFLLPESARFVAVKQDDKKKLIRIVNAITTGTADASTVFIVHEHQQTNKAALRLVVGKPHTAATFSLWVGMFMNLMTVYFLNSWLPLIMKDNHFSLANAALAIAMFQVGGAVGSIAIGRAMDRFSSHKAMMAALAAAGVFTVLLGNVDQGLYSMMSLVFLLGFCIVSANTGWTVMATTYYRTEMRATGTSWMTGIGRFGGIFGVSIGAVLLSFKWSFGELFLALTVPIGLAIIAAYIKGCHNTSEKEAVLRGAHGR
ncbi:AAHS family 4-hydroxybenzoate transporter-like MFS transporter [Paraburkholderia sp. RAU2J]|uniref:MFS transporter n=1 Tax=Paraburkholderia sp. RAU2J TaxID=1938810 RepID=UPI000EADB87D|nr:MFS transporter [Paraburkholderia sp. RAU2J]RKT14203.1 AAHS family 4-hydroxybenzoate transporter-like MFS transporter [Paraburkholderia sp. RAU2J]